LSRTAQHAAALPTLLVATVLAAGCVYRPDIQQGNLLKISTIEQVTVGMSRSQVRYLLGTPMVSDPFAPQRWDYVYSLTYGSERYTDLAHFVVYFDGDKVSGVEKLDLPEPPHRNRPKSWKFWQDSAAASVPDATPEPAAPARPPAATDPKPPGLASSAGA
jgi:outer membrane protein assembly factor BamE